MGFEVPSQYMCQNKSNKLYFYIRTQIAGDLFLFYFFINGRFFLFHSLFSIANWNSLPHFPLDQVFSIKCPSRLKPMHFNNSILALFSISTVSTTLRFVLSETANSEYLLMFPLHTHAFDAYAKL